MCYSKVFGVCNTRKHVAKFVRKLLLNRNLPETSNLFKGTVLGTPNREPQESSRNVIGIYLPSIFLLLYSYYILGVLYLGLPLEPFYSCILAA